MTNKQTPRAVIGTPWFIRKAIYVAAGLLGLVCVAVGLISPDQADQWLLQSGSIGATIAGLLAATNTGRSSDKPPAEEIADNTAATAPAYAAPQPQRVGETYQDIRERVAIHNAD